jgi:hypothetical protein
MNKNIKQIVGILKKAKFKRIEEKKYKVSYKFYEYILDIYPHLVEVYTFVNHKKEPSNFESLYQKVLICGDDKEKKIITYIYSLLPSDVEMRASYLKEYNEFQSPLSKLYVSHSMQELLRHAKQINFGQALYSKKIRHSIAKKLRGL